MTHVKAFSLTKTDILKAAIAATRPELSITGTCPVAQAIGKALKPGFTLSVGSASSISISHKDGGLVATLVAPKVLNKTIDQFDFKHAVVDPVDFEAVVFGPEAIWA